MRIFSGTLITCLVLGTTTAVLAQEQTATPEETRVSREEAGQSIVEHRVEGRLESVSITPPTGPAYFIEDRQGDGSLTSLNDGSVDANFNIRTWKLGVW
ncbi:MAG: hypothetical protein ACI8P9_003754 [Parasphingorhabdus sp.]|jgi:hypothetical protein